MRNQGFLSTIWLLQSLFLAAWNAKTSVAFHPNNSLLGSRRINRYTVTRQCQDRTTTFVSKRKNEVNNNVLLYQSSVGYDSNMAAAVSNTSTEDATRESSSTDIDSQQVLVLASTTTDEPSSVMPPTQEQHVDRSELTKKIFNGLLLALSFGYAAYTIFNIDAGMTRGWTQSEIAMRIPLDNWLNYESSLADRPIFTKTAINVIIYLLGDWLSQTVFAKKNILDFDAGRTLRNGFIGLCFGPLVHEYYQFSDHILPVEGGMWNRLEKIVMDQTIYLTVKCSIYISAVGLLQGDDWHTVKNNVQEKLPNIVLTAWKFWPLVHLVTYGVIPARHRILWVNCVDLVWNAILASMSNKKDVADDEVAVITSEATTTTTIIEEPYFVETIEEHQQHILEHELLLDITTDISAEQIHDYHHHNTHHHNATTTTSIIGDDLMSINNNNKD